MTPPPVRNRVKRKSMHQNIDKVRDKNPKRRAMHRRIDKIRNQREDRKLELKQYEHTKTRRHYINVWNQSRYQRLLSSTLATDTGFDMICSSCMQYKSKRYCRPIEKLDKRKHAQFIVKFCSLLKNRHEGQFICNLCFNDIKKQKVPRRSHISNFKFANFPKNFIIKLKQKCRFKEQALTPKSKEEKENYEKEFFELNRLEAYLLKLVFHFHDYSLDLKISMSLCCLVGDT